MTNKATAAKTTAIALRKKVLRCALYVMNKTGTIDNKAPGIRTLITGNRLLLNRLTIASQTSGLKLVTDPLKATQGPKNMPATKVERMMLISSQTFKVIPQSFRYYVGDAEAPIPSIRRPFQAMFWGFVLGSA